MTETATRIPLLTRRRVMAGAIFVVVVLAVAGLVFGMMDPKPSQPLFVTFLKFAKSKYGDFDVAVVRVENRSKQPGYFKYVGPFGTIIGGFVDGSNAPVVITITNATLVTQAATMAAESQSTQSVLLPQNGARGRVTVEFSLAEKRPPSLLERMRRRWQRVFPPHLHPRMAVCDQEIQCPLLRPDGTIDPPKIMPNDWKSP